MQPLPAEAHAPLPANSSCLCHLYLPFTVLGNPTQTVQPPWAPVATPHPSPISPPPDQEGLAVRQRKKDALNQGCLRSQGGGGGLGWVGGAGWRPALYPILAQHAPISLPWLALAQVDWGLLVHTGESLQALVPGYIIKPSWQMRKQRPREAQSLAQVTEREAARA